jgi:hypothetical protein
MLERSGVAFSRIDGTVPQDERTRAIAAFQSQPEA